LALPALAAAQTLKPLPNPDLSKLSAAQNSELREARAHFDKVSKGQAGVQLAEAYGDIGGFYARAGLFDAAAPAFQNAAQTVPQDDRWVYLQGVIARAQGKNSDARRYFEQAFKLNSMYLPIRMALTAELMRAGETDKASKLLDEAVASNRNEPAPLAVLGEIELRNKRYAEAITHFKEAIRLDPKASALYGSLARAQEGAGNAEAAREAGSKAGNVPPLLNDPLVQRILPIAENSDTSASEPVDPRQPIVGDAVLQAGAGKFDAARKALDAGLKQFPNDALLLAHYARVEIAAGNLAAARTRVNAALAADPKSILALMTQGVLLEMGNDDAGALESYRKVSAIDPRFARAHGAAGDIAMRNGRTADAIAAYRTLVNARPLDVDGWAHLLAAEFVAGQCATSLRETGENAAKNPRSPLFAELDVRAVSTCPAASAEQKKKALAEAEKLYNGTTQDTAQIGEAYALALAANGKWEDAAQTQGASVFAAVSAGDQAAVTQYREFYQRFQGKQLPSRPWPDGHPLFKPARPSVAAKPAAAPAVSQPAKN
jgi:tetratricopeptide (TPR) repeat protein